MESKAAGKGTVVSVSGEVVVVDSKGAEHVLKVGDKINDGDMIVVRAGGQVELDVGKSATETLPEDTAAVVQVDPATGDIVLVIESLGTEEVDVADIQQAILAGQDPTLILEETAAGNAPPSRSGFSEFQTVGRTAEEVIAQAGFDTTPEDRVIDPYVDNEADFPAPPSLYSVADVQVSEGGLMTFTVTRTGGTQAGSIDFSTSIGSGDTAEADDFTATSGTLVFAPGEVSKTFTVQTTQDSIYEGPETFSVSLSNPSNGGEIEDGSAVATIIDDGTGPLPPGTPGTPDDDTTSFSVENASISEGGLMTFTVTRTGDAAADQTIDFATSIASGDNADASDFTASSGTLTFAPGETSKTFTVQTTQDNIYEGAESFTVSLSNNSEGSTIKEGTATGTILDDGTGPLPPGSTGTPDDDSTSFRVGDVSISEGGLMTFTVTRDGDAAADQTIDFATSIGSGDTAEASDFTASSGTLTFAPGETSKTFTVQTTQDSTYEGAETFTVSLSNNSEGSTIADGTATGTILDDGTGPLPPGSTGTPDDDTTSFSVENASISEGGLMTFTVTRTGDAAADQTIDFATSIAAGDNADASDFTASNGTLTFAPGETSKTFTVQTTQDNIYEGPESFTVSLSNNSEGSSIKEGTATGTILDDGTGPLPPGGTGTPDDDTTSFSVENASISEGGLMTFTVTRTGDAAADQTIDFATSIAAGDNADASDFTASNGTLTFAPGETSKTFTVQTTQDNIYEGPESFTVSLSNNSEGSIIKEGTATGTILDDGTGPLPPGSTGTPDDDRTGFSVDDVSISEGGLMTFTVTRSGDAAADQTVDFATSIAAGDSADASDFTANSGTLTFAAGETRKTFTVQTTQDDTYEGPETFTVNLSNATNGGQILEGTATGIILDDGTGPLPPGSTGTPDDDSTSFRVGDVSISEGGLMTFTVTRSGDAAADQTVDFATSIAAGDSAEANDFTGSSGTLTFAPGETSKSFTVQTAQDSTYEGPETFTVSLSNNSEGSTIAEGTATGTILDDGTGPGPFDPSGPGTPDDDSTSFSVADVSISEGGLMTFTVTRTGDAAADQTVDFATSIAAGDSAEANDFTGNSGTLTFAAGETSKSFTVQTTQDSTYEGPETFTVSLSNNSEGSTIKEGTATGTILDDGTGPLPPGSTGTPDDDRTGFSVDDVSISEGGLMTFTVTRSGDAAADQTVDFATSIAAGDSADASDFTANSGTLTFAAGETRKTFTVQTTQDDTYEGPETFTVNLSNATNGGQILEGTATGTILDDGTGPLPPGSTGTPDDDSTSFRVGDVSISEGGLMTFTVTRTGDAAADQTIDFATSIAAGDSAEANDFTGSSGTLTFAPGETSKSFTVQTAQDSTYEGPETFTVSLSNNSEGSTIAEGTATGTILDDGTGPGPFDPSGPGTPDDDSTSFSVADVSISEGGLMTFTVTRTGDAAADQTVDFATSIAAGDSAEANDFTGNSGTLTFAAGETSKSFTVQTTQDSTYEGPETFTVSLSNNSEGSTIKEGTATGTILDDGTGPLPPGSTGTPDDDRTGFSVDDVSISEGGLMTFTVTRSGDAAADQTVDFATSIAAGDSADASDFTANSGTLTFAAGETRKTFTVQTTQDDTYEGPETFTVNLSNATNGGQILEGTATGTILDDGTGPLPPGSTGTPDDDSTSFRVGDVSISEGGLMTFTVTRSGDAAADQTVDFATSIAAGDSAEANDFTGSSGTLTFAPGETSKSFTVQTAQDSTYEGPETFTVSLSNNSEGSTIAEGTATGTILDDGTGPGPFDPSGPGTPDDDSTSFSVADVSISEGGLMTFTVTRTGDAAADQTVDFATSIAAGDSAEANDFTGNSGTLTFAAGETSKSFTVQTTQDSTYEGPETFTVSLSNNSEGSTIKEGTATGTILDDGTGPLPPGSTGTPDDDRTGFSVDDVSISEGGLMTFTVTRSGDAAADQTVDFATSIAAGDSADASDFTANSGTLTFAAGETRKTFTVQTTQDDTYEGPETFTVNLSNATNGGQILEGTATGIILDDGTGPLPPGSTGTPDDDSTSFRVGDVSISEGGLMTFTVTRSGDAAADQTVDFATSIAAGDSAEANDFTGSSGTLTFAPGETSKSFTVQTAQDSTYEGPETFTVSLSNNSEGSTIAEGTATGTILDDGTGPGPFDPSGPGTPDDDSTSFSVADVSISEGGLMTFTVTRTGDAAADQTVDFATSIAAGDSAEANDFTGNSGTLTFAAGETSKSFTVQTTQDSTYEGPETFTVSLSNNSEGSTIKEGTATGTILDDGTGPLPPGSTGTPDDDRTGFSVDDVSISEGGLMTFTVTRSGDAAADQTVDFATSIAAGDSADASDFTANSGTLTFAAGETRKTFTVQTTQDDTYEGPETFTVNLSNATNGGQILEGTATGTILDDGTGPLPPGSTGTPDDDSTSFRVGDVSISEGGLMTFTVTRSGDAAADQTVDFATSIAAGDSAEANDFTGSSGTLTFAPGETSKSFTVQTAQDSTYEGPETFTVSLSNNSEGSTIAEGTATGTILDDGTGPGPFDPSGPGTPDDDSTSFSVADVSISEGGLMTFTVTRTGDAAADQTVDFATSIAAGDSAEANDFTGNSGTLTFAAGETSKSFTVQTTQDSTYEGPETFTVSLSNNSEGSTIKEGTATGTILDDGTGPLPPGSTGTPDDDRTGFSVDDVSISEGGLMTFTVTRSGDAAADQTVDFATSIAAGDSADASDFTANSGTLTFAAGETRKTFTVQTTQDDTYEGPETFTVNLSNATNGGQILEGTATGIILDDGTGPLPPGSTGTPDDDSTSFRVGDVSISEGGLMTFTVTRSGDAAADQTVDFATSIAAGDSAEANDFTGSSGTLTFAPGETSKSFTVQTAQDSTYEGPETFTVSLSNNSEGSTIAEGTATGTILDDGTGPGPFDPSGPGTPDDDSTSFSVADVSISEGGLMTFTVTRTGDAAADQTVDFATSIAAGDSAEANDFTGNSGTLTFAAGETSKSFTVQTTQDSTYEGPETFTVSLSNNSEGSTIKEGTATGTILDDGTGPLPPGSTGTPDDDRTGFSVDDVSISEGGLMTFTVTRSGDAAADQTVDFATSIAAGDSADASDFTANSGTLTFAAGETRKTFTVQTTQDDTYEGPETFTVNLSNATNGGQILEGTATGTILDDGTGPLPPGSTGTPDDDSTSFRVGDVSISEGGLMTFTVTRSGDAAADQTVDFATSIAAGDSAEANDFTGSSGTLTFAPGETSKSFTVQTAQDSTYEGPETFTVSLSNNSEGSTIAEGTATGTILDDGTGPGPFDPSGPGTPDDDSTSFSVADVSISEGGLMTFTVTRTGDAAADQTVDFATSIAAGDSAEANDFTGNSGTLTFAAGETSKSFTVQTTQDSTYEGPETFTVSLSNNSEGSTIKEGTATGTILDDGTGPLPPGSTGTPDDDRTGFSVDDVSISEGGLMTFTVTRSGDAAADQTVDFATSIAAGDSADASDFTANSGTLTFAAGETRKTFTVQTTQDDTYEGPETFTVNLSNATNGGQILEGTATGTILDDGTGPLPPGSTGTPDDDSTSFRVGDVSISEGGLMTFTVTRSGDAAADQTVDFATSIAAGDSAEANDFTGSSGTLTFAPGETSKSFTVQTAQDSTYEGPETFTVSLSNNSEGSTIAEGTATGTILDDGTGPGPFDPSGPGTPDDDSTSFSVADVSISEGGLMTFTVTRTGDAAADQTVDFATSIAAGDSAEANDFTGNSGTLTFAAGETSKSFTVQTTQDSTYEGPETFTVSLSNNSEGSTIKEGTATGTILDDGTGPLPPGSTGTPDDDRTGFSVDDVSISEGGLMTFTVTRSGDAAADQTVDFATSIAAGDSADASDFTANSGTLTFAAGETRKTFTVQTTQDDTYEGPETFTVNLSNATNGGQILEGTATGTILDDGTGPLPPGSTGTPDDDSTSFRVGDVSISEGGLMTFTVTRSGDAAADQTVDFATSIAAGDSAEANDFTGSSGTLTFAPGETSKSFTVQTAQDSTYEGPETFTVSLSNNSEGSTIAEGTATGTILDDGTGPGPFDPSGPGTPDDDSTSFSVADVSISEGGLMTFTVTRTGDAAADQTVDFATSIAAGDSAEANDFTGNSGTLTFAAGETSKSFTVQTTQDSTYEGPETFTVSLSNNSEGSTIKEGTATGTILDDGTGPLPPGSTGTPDDDRTGFSVDDVSISEGGLMTFTVTRSGDAAADQTVDFATSIAAGDSADASDFTANSGTLTFAAGETRKTFTVQTTQDDTYEGPETFTVNLSNATNGGQILEGTATGTILDDGTGPLPPGSTGTPDDDSTSFRVGDVSISEGGLMTFTVTRSGDAAADQTVDFATSIAAGDSAEVNDFTGSSGTLTFAPGETSKSFTVQTAQDSTYEGPETFTVSLSNNSEGSTIAEGTATGTILDDGTGPGPFDPSGPGTPDNDVPTLSVSSPTVVEGGQMEFTISLSNQSLEAISFSVATVDTGSATDTADYSPALEYFNAGSGSWEPVTGDLSFAPGETSLQVRSATEQDTQVEGSESFDLTATVTGGTTTNSSATGTGTITDDDNIPDAVNSSASTQEDTTLTFSAADFGFSDLDAGNTLQAIRIESLPTEGTLFFNGVEITAANLASFNAGSNEVSSTDIGLLTFEPALNDSGYDSYNAAGEGDQLNDYDSITFSVSDGANWSSAPATLTIDVTPVADAPTLTVDGTQTSGGIDLVDLITVPASAGLVKTVYTNTGISPATVDSSNLETLSDGLVGGTSTVVTQPYRDAESASDANSIAVDSVEVTTGVIYLEAGSTLSFNGYLDDSFRIELGGKTLIDTTGDAFGNYDTSTVATADVGSGTVSTYGDFTAASSGYYTFEMYIYNHIAAGDLSVNVSVNGGASQPFNASAVNMYTGIDAVDAAQGQHSELILTSGSDGGFYPVELNKGYEGTPIKLTAVDSALVDTDGSEVLSSIVISSIPDGSELTDGTNSFTATAGNTSVDVTSWNLDNLSYTGHTDLPNGDSEVHTLIVTATSQEMADGAVVDTATSTANLNITVIETNDASVITSIDAVSVSEEGLTGGLADTTGDPVDTTDDASATGVINFTDSDSSAFTLELTGLTSASSEGNPINLTSGGDDVDSWSWDASTQTLTGSTSAGVDVLTITLDPVVSSGSNNSVSYTVNLLAPVDHPVNNTEDVMDLQFGIAISDGSNTVDSSLNVRIEDDRPVSGDLNNSLEVPLAQSNVMLVLDFSGSMAGSNLDNMKAAVISMLDSYDNAGYTAIQIVTFSSTATVPGDGGWISVAEAKSYINALTDADMGGATNYDAALAAAQNAFAETNGYIAGGKNISYFLSDGEPTSGNEIDTGGDQTAWETFVTNNNIDSFAVGFGGAAVTALEPIAYNGVDTTERPAIDATAAGSTLTESLLATVSTPIPGNLFGSLTSGGFGADGNGHVLTVTIDSVTYTYDNTAGTITNSANSDVINDSSVAITTSQGGVMTINMETGEYSYEADPNFTVDFAETLNFTIQDMDGDVTSGSVNVDISREVKPTPTLNSNTAEVFEADMADGTHSAGTGEVATGNILADDTIPTGLSLSTVSIAGGTTVVNGNLITVTTSAGNTLVVDSTTGDYTYTLVNAVDHTQLVDTGNTITLASDTFSGSLDGWGGSNVALNGNRMLIDGANDTATKTFDFGETYANQTVTVSFDFEATSNWDGGSDNFVVTVNGTDVINDSHTGGTRAYSFDVTLDDQGQADVVLLNSSSSNFEDAYVDNFTISGPEIVAVPTDTAVDSFTYVVTDPGGTPYTSTLDVTIHDDVPQVNNSIAVSVDVPESVATNVIMTLDVSGSMNQSVNGGSTRFELAKQAMIDTIKAYDNQGSANVSLTLFAQQAITVDTWMTAQEAIDYLNLLSLDTGTIQYNGAGIPGMGVASTNYEAAVAVTESGYAGAPAADKTVAYYLSDGEPTVEYDDSTATATDVTGNNAQDGVGSGFLDSAYLNSWDSFITNNNIALEVIGIGTNLSVDYLNQVQVIPGKTSQVVADITTLSDVMLSTVAPVEGSLFGSDGDSGIMFGADGGHILELSYDGVTYSYDPANPIQTIALSEGDMALNFETGTFTYTANVSNGTDVIENFIISVKDSDGDSSLNQPLSMLIGKNQTITGTDSSETLDGAAGNDILDGGLGDDILVGGAGDDLLMGGAGADTFEWNSGDQGTVSMPASDHVQDFTVADNDKLDLSGLLDALGMTDPGLVESYLSLTENASNQAVLNVKDSDGGSVVQEIVLDNVSIQDLKADLSLDSGASNSDLLNQLIDQSKLIV